jgi:hypothetical protein
MIQFAHPLFLWTLPLALLPVLWHRLFRRKQPLPVVEFPAMRLLEKAAQRDRRRQRRREWLLLAVRVLTLAALIAGFARPYRGESLPGGTAATGVEIVCDRPDRLEAALGEWPRTGPNLLVMTSERLSESERFGIRYGEIVSGETAVSRSPYFHPALSVFDRPGRGDLSAATVRRWWKLEPVGRAAVVAWLENGDPFLVEHHGAEGRTIVCAVGLDGGWSDLPGTANFVPMARELVRYLESGPAGTRAVVPRSARDFTGWLLGVAVVLGLAEMLVGGFAWMKWVPVGLLVGLIVHPTFSWVCGESYAGETVVVIDETESMRWRTLPALPSGRKIEITGRQTDLGGALLALTNQAVGSVVLVSDGQHNRGLSPVWASLALGRPIRVIKPEPLAPAKDISVVRAEAPSRVWAGERMPVTVDVVAYGVERVTLVVDDVWRTNVSPGRVALRIATGNGQHTIRAEVVSGELTWENNARSVVAEVVSGKVRVALVGDELSWEYRHVRSVLRNDPAVELVKSDAHVVLEVAGGATWKLRGQGKEAFEGYWRDRVRREFGRRQGWRETKVDGEDEMYRLERNDRLLDELARLGGEGDEERGRYDLRDQWWMLAAAVGLLMGFWLRGRKTGKRRPFSV